MAKLFLKARLKECQTKDHNVAQSETKQLNFINIFKPINWKHMEHTQNKSILESHIFLKQKGDGKIKRQTVDSGSKQRD